MNRYIAILMMTSAVILSSCDKDNTPEPTPVTPGHMANYFVLNGTEFPLSNEDTTYYWTSNNSTTVLSQTGDRFFCVSFPDTDTITFHALGNNPQYIISFGLNGEGYSRPDIWIHVTRYDSVGGRIVGTFEGTVKQNSDTTVVLPVSGAFNVMRGPDIQ